MNRSNEEKKKGQLRLLPWGREGRGLINLLAYALRINPYLPLRHQQDPSRGEGIGKLGFCLLIFFCISCTNKLSAPIIHIALSNNKRSLQITGFDNTVMQEINRDSAGRGWQTLLPVYRMPADTDMKNYQPVQPGTYQLNNNTVVFTPDTPFTGQQTYFLRYYKFDANSHLGDFISGQNRLGNLPYTDLTFKQ